jgi:hypothetical protein
MVDAKLIIRMVIVIRVKLKTIYLMAMVNINLHRKKLNITVFGIKGFSMDKVK